MEPIIEAAFPWEKQSITITKKNQELGNLFTVIFVFTYFLLFVFTILGKLYPLLRILDENLLGYKSLLVIALGYLVYNWWISILLFFPALIITIVLSMLITKTSLGVFKSYLVYLKIDFKNKKRGLIIKTIIRDISVIAGFAIGVFLILEFITFALSALIASFILPIVYSLNETSLANVFLSLLISHIIFFPLCVFFYNKLIQKKIIKTDAFDIGEFMKEDGEIDMEKWKSRTWGKKPYTFDWEEEDVFPITCLSCGTIISSDLTECPICGTDLIKEIEAIDTEYSFETTEGENQQDVLDKTGEEDKN